MLPATHDTGSAFLAVPARDEHAVYLSSGTWSLLGVETKEPLTDEESRRANFTNEGGAWHRFRYLKNIMGLWMIQSVRRELSGDSYVAGRGIRQETGKKWSFSELEAAARQSGDFESTVDVNRPVFLSPDSMITAVKEECRRTGQRVPESVGAVMQCIYRSLALCYRNAIRDLSRLTGRQYTSVNIVSGGCKDDYLNILTARATGLPVLAGPVEGTAIGNLAVQMIAAGEFKNLSDAREAIRRSFEVKEVTG
ncbi:MAG: FGGY-family carbohydrate kinase [Eubacteriales bacterium]|nr:FGGY-family carbohydrate kinase [Eubacteriales bacterium]